MPRKKSNNYGGGATLLGLIVLAVILSKYVNWANIPGITIVGNALGNAVAPLTCTNSNTTDYLCRSPYGQMLIPKKDVSGVSNSLKLRVNYEPWFANALRAARPSAVALDVGAHVGYHTLAMASYFKKVMAFEPNKEIFPYLLRNTSQFQNVLCVNAGAGSYTGSTAFVRESISSRSHIVGKNINVTAECADCVQVVRLDDYVHDDVEVGFIKFDIEGGEIDALNGARRLIARHKPVIIFEDHTGDTVRFLQALSGYAIEKINASNFIAKPQRNFVG